VRRLHEIGDTAGMIAPLCGDGMAMALRSATLVVSPASDFLNGRIAASDFRVRRAQVWHRDFSRRMQIGRWAHHGYIRPLFANTAIGFAASCLRSADGLFETRGGEERYSALLRGLCNSIV